MTSVTNAMDSTFEALALHYATFGLCAVVNNLWTLVAVVTAAVSFWRIRSSSSSSPTAGKFAFFHRELGSPPSDHAARSYECRSVPERRSDEAIAEDVVGLDADDSCAVSPSLSIDCGCGPEDGVTRGKKFTAYYKEEINECDAATAHEEEAEEKEEGGDCSGGAWWESWNRVLKVRNGDMWWYRCQDTAVLSGAVVRLWEETRESRGGGLSRCNPACAVW